MNVDETVLAECLEDYRSRRAAGEEVEPDLYRERLDGGYEEFLELLSTETLFDQALEIPSEFQLPRPFGGYTLLREVGRGSVGIVYEALDEQHDRVVALKVLRTGFASDPNARQRFFREAEACEEILHLNIVEIFAAGEAEGRPFYAMTLVRGSNLADLIRSGNSPSPRAVCGALSGVASALAMLHENGIVHRDVKPSNIIVDDDDRMVLTDFGLIRVDTSQSLTRTGSTLGTPLYMSPEQMMGRNTVDARSDIYSLGATLYEALTGSPPFDADDYQRLMPKILNERPRNPSRGNPSIPKPCSNIALMCLEKDPRDRYASAEDLAADLRACAESRPVRGKPIGALRRAWRLTTRRPIAASLLLLVAVAAIVFAATRPPPEPAWLSLTLEPLDGEMQLNGGDPMFPPLERFPLEPGHYVMRCYAVDFGDWEIEFEARAGTEHAFNVSLPLPFPVSPEKMEEISRRLNRQLPADVDAAPERGGGGGGGENDGK